MNKNLIIVLLAVPLLLSIVFGVYQKMRADENETLAVLNERLAKEMILHAGQQMMLAEEQRRMAEANAMEAIKQQQNCFRNTQEEREQVTA